MPWDSIRERKARRCKYAHLENVEKKKGILKKHRDATRGEAENSRVVWADCKLKDRGQDVYQLLKKKLVRFRREVEEGTVVAYSVVYGVHPRLFEFAQDGSMISANGF